MPMDGLTLGFAARELSALLTGGRVEKVTQPEKDLVLLLIRAGGKNHKLLLCASPSFARAHITAQAYVNPMDAPMFCMLLRKHLTGGRVEEISQLGGDRVLKIVVVSRDELGDAAPRELYLELMGRHSNLTLVTEGRIVDAVRHVSFDMSRVRQALPGLPFIPPPVQDKLDGETVTAAALLDRLAPLSGRLDKALPQCLRGLSAAAAREIALRATGLSQADIGDIDLPGTADKIAAFMQKLPTLGPPQLVLDGAGLPADVLPFPYLSVDGALCRPRPTLSLALDQFYSGRDRQDRMAQKSAALKRLIKTAIERDEKKLTLQEEELSAGARMDEYRVAGELLSAQLYLVQKGADKVSLQNFYDPDGGTVEIALDASLTPAQNAQRYFKRYRKARGAMATAAEQKEKTLREIDVLENALEDIGKCETEEDLADVRAALAQAGIIKHAGPRKGPRRDGVSKPMSFVSPGGFTVLVGKSGVQNDRLTQSGRAGDVWLHAKDMPGSHVLLRAEGRQVPKEDVVFAAKLAAFYSKGRGQGVPVDYTDRRLVKKPSGAPAGFVVYTGQRALLMDCTQAEAQAMAAGGKDG